MSDDLVLLGPEGDCMDALAVLHGVTASMALALRGRLAAGGSRKLAHQARALTAVANGFARHFRHDDEPGFETEIAPALIELMRHADRRERQGVRHDRLVKLAANWPFRRLEINPPALALVAIMRLRQALQDELLRGDDDIRRVAHAAQLAIVRGFEADLLRLARDLGEHKITAPAALLRVRDRFKTAALAIRPNDVTDLLLGDGQALASQWDDLAPEITL